MNNLVDNAIKYSEKGSEITISTSNEGKDYIKVAVEDNGEGYHQKIKIRFLVDFLEQLLQELLITRVADLGLQ